MMNNVKREAKNKREKMSSGFSPPLILVLLGKHGTTLLVQHLESSIISIRPLTDVQPGAAYTLSRSSLKVM